MNIRFDVFLYGGPYFCVSSPNHRGLWFLPEFRIETCVLKWFFLYLLSPNDADYQYKSNPYTIFQIQMIICVHNIIHKIWKNMHFRRYTEVSHLTWKHTSLEKRKVHSTFLKINRVFICKAHNNDDDKFMNDYISSFLDFK